MVELETSLQYERKTVRTLTEENRAQAERINRLQDEVESFRIQREESATRWKQAEQELTILRQTKINLEEVIRTTEAAREITTKQEKVAQAEESEKQRSVAAARARSISAWKLAQLPEIEAGAETVRIQVRHARREGAIAEASHIVETMREDRVKAEYQNPLESQERYETQQKVETQLVPFPDLIYIAGLNSVADNEEQELTLYSAGFREEPGSSKRFRQYALTAERAASLLAEQQSF